MDIDIVNSQIYHNIKIGTKSIDFKDLKGNIQDESTWKQFIIYSFLNLYKIRPNNKNVEEMCQKLLNGDNDIDYITYKEFNNLLYNALVGMNFMLDDITLEQYKALEDFLNNNDNVIGKCYMTESKENCKEKLKTLNKNLKCDNIKS